MNDNKEKWTKKIGRYFREAFSWFDAGLMLNATLIMAITFAGCFAMMQWKFNRELGKVEEVLYTISSFMTTATEDEYRDIADELHYSMVKRTLSEDDLKYLDYIPNTAENCPFEDTGHTSGPYLVALNTGKLYDLAVYTEEYPLEKKGQYGPYTMDFGYDEVSQTNIFLDFDRDSGTAEVDLARKNGEISIHRLKGYFCEECIRELAELLAYKSVLEFVVYDAETDTIYPIVESAEYEAGDYAISITRNVETGHNDYLLSVSYLAQQ